MDSVVQVPMEKQVHVPMVQTVTWSHGKCWTPPVCHPTIRLGGIETP